MRTFKVLLVEDNDNHREEIIKAIDSLNKPKIQLIAVKSGEEAYQLLKVDLTINLCIFDIKLPDFPGDTLLRYVKTKYLLPMTPVIMLTSSSSYKDCERCSDFNVDDYVLKPQKIQSDNFGELIVVLLKYYKKWSKGRG